MNFESQLRAQVAFKCEIHTEHFKGSYLKIIRTACTNL